MEYVDFPSFSGKLRKQECVVQKLDLSFNQADTRCWSALINPGSDNIIVTFNVNRYNVGNKYFDIMSSERIISDVYVDDIYETLEMLLNKVAANKTLTLQTEEDYVE